MSLNSARGRVGLVVSVAAVALIIGLGLGSLAFPMTRTVPTTVVQTTFTTIIKSGTSSFSIITFTQETLEVNIIVPYCTTISGSPTVEFSQAVGGYTTITYVHAGSSLPSTFIGNVTTATTVGAENVTQSSAIC